MGINSLDGQAADITTGQARLASNNNWSFVDSPALSANNFSIVTESENNKDDNLFDFLWMIKFNTFSSFKSLNNYVSSYDNICYVFL